MVTPPDMSQHALDAALSLGSDADLGVALQQIAASAQTALGAVRATCYACAPGAGTVEALYTTEVEPARRKVIEGALGRGWDELPVSRLLDRTSDGVLVVEDLRLDPDAPPEMAALLDAGSLLGVRLQHGSVTGGGRPLPMGALFCSFARPRHFRESERATLLALGNLASLALANAHLQQFATAGLARLTALEAEQAALLRVATRVAMSDSSAQAVFDVAAEEACGLLGATTAMVARRSGAVAQVMSGVGDAERHGLEVPILPGGVLHGAIEGGRHTAVDDYESLDIDAPPRVHALRAGCRSAAAAPIRAEGRVWGALVAAFADPAGVDGEGRERLQHFADLVGLAIANAETRTRLVERSTRDPLTGLANHRTFFDCLDQEVARATLGGRPLALVMIDLDHFKRINDDHGHLTGDAVLVALTERLGAMVRSEDLLGRIGGEEFAWLMPDTHPEDALSAAERAREAVGDDPVSGVGRVTLSAGVAALGPGDAARHLFAAADAALYRAKAAGRNRCEAAEARPAGGDPPAP